MHRNLITKIVEHGSNDDMHKLKHIMCKVVDKLKILDYDDYKEAEYELYKIALGKHLNEELAKEWTSKMINKDGTHGEHWTIDQTQQFNSKYDKYDWYAILNMHYSDYYNPKFSTSDYVEMTKDWFNDQDADECKTLKYYMLVVR